MKFGNPNFIYSFLIILALIAFYIFAFKTRKVALKKFAQKGLLKDLLLTVNPAMQRLKVILLILGVALCLLALMRPQWGFRWEEVKRKGLDIIIALDTSKSMLAQDIKPNRLERSKLAIIDLTKNLKSDRIGLVAFSGSAFLQCPLTVDYGGFLLSTESINVETIPKGGTSISSAIREAIKSYAGGQKKYKVLVIITDGEDHEGGALKAAEDAKKEGITIFCIGIGTKEGDLIPITQNDGRKEFLKDKEGNVIKSKLDEITLQKIALTTGGSYLRSTAREFGLDLLYKERLSKMEKRELEGKMVKQYEERFQIILGIALLLFLSEPIINDRKTITN